MAQIPTNIRRCVIDSSAWTGRTEKPQPKPEPPRPTFRDDLVRLAQEHGIDFASRVAASYNSVWR